MVHWWAAGSLWQREVKGRTHFPSFLPSQRCNELCECVSVFFFLSLLNFVCVCVCIFLPFLFLSGISSDAVAKFEGGSVTAK